MRGKEKGAGGLLPPPAGLSNLSVEGDEVGLLDADDLGGDLVFGASRRDEEGLELILADGHAVDLEDHEGLLASGGEAEERLGRRWRQSFRGRRP